MRAIGIAVLVVGCTPEAVRSREVRTPVSVAPAGVDGSSDGATARALPESRRAGVMSPPRDQWPCALAAEVGGRTTAVFRYGERTSCRIPRALAVFGVHGCPESVAQIGADAMITTRTFEYDGDGRMTVFHGDVTRSFGWDGDRLVSVRREHGAVDIARYFDDDAAIVAVDEHGERREVLTLAGDRLVQWVELADGRPRADARVEWSNERPSKVQGSLAQTFLYDCPASVVRDATAPAPQPDPAIASLPVDARVADWAAVLATHRRDCAAFRARPCELVADFDGDGTKDRAVKIRERSTRRAGIAISWGTGGVSIVGAGVETRQLSTDVHLEGIDLSWSVVEDDLAFLARWAIVARSDRGFAGAGPRRAVGGGAESPAPAATGAGLLLDGGDAAEVLYWDGLRWRRLILGY